MAIDNKAYLFHVSNTLNTSDKNKLRSAFSIYANDSETLQRNIVEPWQKKNF